MNHPIIEFTIKATLIWACTGLVLWATQIRDAAGRHKAWTCVMLLMLLLPLWTTWGPMARVPVASFLPVPLTDVVQVAGRTAREPAAAAAAQKAERSAVNRSWNWMSLGFGVYIVGACTFLLRLGMGTIGARRLVSRSVVHHGQVTSRACTVPITVGLIRPVTILPESWPEWPQQQLDLVLTHEREHARRRDPLVQWLALLNRALFWFHPLAWWLERELSLLAEQACDDAVLARGHDPQVYSECLLAMERSVILSGRRLNRTGVAMPGGFLSSRITRILEGLEARPLSRRQIACSIVACAISSGFVAAATLDFKPSRQPRFAPAAPVAVSSSEAPLAEVLVKRVPSRQPYAPQAPMPKWAGTWKLNKEKSRFGLDSRIHALVDSLESATLKLDATSEDITIATDLLGIRPIFRQHAEIALKSGITTNLQEINPTLAVAYPGTITIAPVLETSFNITITYSDGSGSSILRFEVSDDGSTLTETSTDNNFRGVFDRSSR